MNNLINIILIVFGFLIGYILVAIPAGIVFVAIYKMGMEHERMIWEARDNELMQTLSDCECDYNVQFINPRDCTAPDKVVTTYEAPNHEILGVFGEN